MTVLDASVVGAWFVPGQGTVSADVMLRQAAGIRFVAPSIFPAECRSLFLKAERRGLIDEDLTRRSLETLGLFDIDILARPDSAEHDLVLSLARRENISYYDAMYLRVGLLRADGLASRDGALLVAATRCGLTVHDLRT